MLKTLLIIILAVFVLFNLFDFIRTYRLYRVGLDLADSASPYNRVLEQADKNILLIGDSTALGVGVNDHQDTLAGLWAQEFDNANIINIASNGAKVSDIMKMLADIEEDFDLIFLHAGANNIIRFTNIGALKNDTDDLLNLASSKAEKVFWVSSGNIGAAPFFPHILRPMLSWQTKKARSVFMNLSNKYDNIHYIDLFTPRNEDIFRDNIEYNYAQDKLHPGIGGYKIWFNKINRELQRKLKPTNSS